MIWTSSVIFFGWCGNYLFTTPWSDIEILLYIEIFSDFFLQEAASRKDRPDKVSLSPYPYILLWTRDIFPSYWPNRSIFDNPRLVENRRFNCTFNSSSQTVIDTYLTGSLESETYTCDIARDLRRLAARSLHQVDCWLLLERTLILQK